MLGIAVPILVRLRIPGGLPYPHVSPLLCPRSDAQIFTVFKSCHVWPGEVPTERFEDESDRRKNVSAYTASLACPSSHIVVCRVHSFSIGHMESRWLNRAT